MVDLMIRERTVIMNANKFGSFPCKVFRNALDRLHENLHIQLAQLASQKGWHASNQPLVAPLLIATTFMDDCRLESTRGLCACLQSLIFCV